MWLYAVTRHVVLDRASRCYRGTLVARYLDSSGMPGKTQITWSSIARVPSLDVQLAVNQATRELTSLPTQRRTVFYLHEILGWSYSEIAEEMHITVATARVHLHHAREALRDVVADATQCVAPPTTRATSARGLRYEAAWWSADFGPDGFFVDAERGITRLRALCSSLPWALSSGSVSS